MWRGVTRSDTQVLYFDADFSVSPQVVCTWDKLPIRDASVDVIIYDPPHLPLAAATRASYHPDSTCPLYKRYYGLEKSIKGDDISALHPPFLSEAKRVLVPDGLIFSKIKDFIHNHEYRWNMHLFNNKVREAGMTPCDLIIKLDPCGGNLKSGRWIRSHHAKGVHCYWVVVRNSARCESKNKRKAK
jgi:hypothetical protein